MAVLLALFCDQPKTGWKHCPTLMNTTPTYCYWSVATGSHAELMERCVASAREAGVFKEFHIMTDRPIKGAESYEAYEVELTDKLFKLVYLKAAISKLNFDYYVWLDADTVFRRNPRNLLASLWRSPIHVPLEVNLSALIEESQFAAESLDGATGMSPFRGRKENGNTAPAPVDVDAPQPRLYGLSMRKYVELFAAAGVNNPVYWSGSAFWIIRRTAIERVCELALHFRAFARERSVTVDATAGLSYAMQMLCANPGRHELSVRPDLWMSTKGMGQDGFPMSEPFVLHNPLTDAVETRDPAVVHLSSKVGRSTVSTLANQQEVNHELANAV